MEKSKRTQTIKSKQERLELYYNQEKEMLSAGVQSYGIGSYNLSRYNIALSGIQSEIKKLEEEIGDLQDQESGMASRKMVGVVPMDW